MRFFGLEITRQKAARPIPFGSSGRWANVFSGFTPGWFQSDLKPSTETSLSNNAVYACVTLIASDIGKLRPRLCEMTDDGIWQETTSPAFSPVLRRPNRYQNHIQFKEWWVTSKLLHGNTYVLLARDGRNVITGMYILDPLRVQPLVSPDGSVFYELNEDNLSGVIEPTIRVPASEVIHDRMNCLFHPLVGMSPLFASGKTAEQALKIQKNSTSFFGNNSSPGGLLIAPGSLTDQNAKQLKDYWEANFTGSNAGKLAVFGDGMKYQPMRMSAVESQLIEQANLSAQVICSTFHVPPFMVGLGAEPAYANGETRTQSYYDQCLQTLMESMEEAMNLAFGFDTATGGRPLCVNLDLTGLLRMDSKTQMETLTAGVKGAVMTPNEGRKVLNLPKLEGGDTVYMQQQQFSLAALSKRDQTADPFGKAPAASTAAPAADPAALAADAAAKAVDDALVVIKGQADEIEARRTEVDRLAQEQRDADEALRHAEVAAQVGRVADVVLAAAAEASTKAQEVEAAAERRQADALAVLERAAQQVAQEPAAEPIDEAGDFARALIAKFTEATNAG